MKLDDSQRSRLRVTDESLRALMVRLIVLLKSFSKGTPSDPVWVIWEPIRGRSSATTASSFMVPTDEVSSVESFLLE